ncbi:MAG: hypothetical protein AB1582_21455, partial [Pseudomonadota bacterium]
VLPALYPARISVSSSLLAATMNQKSSLREDPQFVSGVLTGNTTKPTNQWFQPSRSFFPDLIDWYISTNNRYVYTKS